MVRQPRPRKSNRRTLAARLALILFAASLTTIGGCWSSTTDTKPADAAYMASGGVPANHSPASRDTLERPSSDTGPADSQGLMDGASKVPEPLRRMAADSTRPTPDQSSERSADNRSPDVTPPGTTADETAGRTQLPPDLPPTKLIEFLAVADRDMQDIWSRLPQIQGGRDELIRIAKMKLEASRRLQEHSDADETAKSSGARGELQALSHLASFSDLKSAQDLEELAIKNLESNDPDLVADSRLVLIGFALESLQNGEADAAEKVMVYVDQIAATQSATDVPTLMVLGQARDALARYGHEEDANHVRSTIIELFSDSPNPDLAMAARELAGNIIFDDIEQLFGNIVSGESVSVEKWRSTVDKLIAGAPDLQSVQYLAGLALQLESRGENALVDTTFEALTNGLADPESDASREVQVAIEAKEARHNIIGIRFNPLLPSVGDTELSIEEYRGRVVLLPFWAAAFPESLQLIGALKEIQAARPNDVAIVGVNLDGNDLVLQKFVDQNEIGFPSFRSKSSTQAEVANTVAAQFGIASMPFLAILDQEGRVAAINFTGQGIQERVEELLAK